MDSVELIPFVTKYWYLFAALGVILALLVGGEVVRLMRGIPPINAQQALALMNHDDAVMLDIRDNKAFHAGHIPGARNVPVADLAKRSADLNRFKDKPVIVYCDTGVRSGAAGASLKKAGFAKVHTLQGGLAAWTGANLPLQRK